jgi:hydroxymethylpyrimidine pyrophosphatase-like HAD family hydrolase
MADINCKKHNALINIETCIARRKAFKELRGRMIPEFPECQECSANLYKKQDKPFKPPVEKAVKALQENGHFIHDQQPLKEEVKKMSLDKGKLKELHAAGKTDKEIATELNAKVGTVWAARNAMGLQPNKSDKSTKSQNLGGARPGSGRKKKNPSNQVEKPEQKKETQRSENLYELTSLGALIAERNQLQERVFKLNQAIEILSK